MFAKLLLLFTMVPLVELIILIKVGEVLGTLNTVLIVILTGILGAAFAKTQGLGIIQQIRRTVEAGRIPGRELLQGLMILVGGIMLITPGFLTDLAGLSLLLPLTRKMYTDWLVAYFRRKVRSRHRHIYSQFNQADPFHREDVYDDLEFDDDNDKPEIIQ